MWPYLQSEGVHEEQKHERRQDAWDGVGDAIGGLGDHRQSDTHQQRARRRAERDGLEAELADQRAQCKREQHERNGLMAQKLKEAMDAGLRHRSDGVEHLADHAMCDRGRSALCGGRSAENQERHTSDAGECQLRSCADPGVNHDETPASPWSSGSGSSSGAQWHV